MKRGCLAVVVTALLIGATPATAGTDTRSRTGIFDARYCEVLEVRGQSPDLTVNVWNTLGLNTCPEARWRRLDAPSLVEELGAFTVVLNGPRHFVMDRAAATPAGGVRSFQGLRMRHLAKIDIGETANLVEAPYGERTIKRRNTFVWNRGRRVYELISPNRRVYVMQSYSLMVDPKLTASRLRRLGSRLKLPEGWRFRTRRLRRELDLTVKRRATIVRDELGNAYQRAR